jgi:hypothetical protein
MSGDSRWNLPSWTWTLPQRRALLLLLALLAAFLAIRYALNPVYVSDPQPERPEHFDDLADGIDPNTAEWSALAALPGVGESRARDIVAYREQAKRSRPEGVVFTKPEDLLRIKGIGAAMLEGMAPHLTFPPTAAPATTRSIPAPHP